MDGINLGPTFKRAKPRFVPIICRHVRHNPGSQKHEFPSRPVIRCSLTGPPVDLSAEFPANPPAAGNIDEEPTDTKHTGPSSAKISQVKDHRMAGGCGHEIQQLWLGLTFRPGRGGLLVQLSLASCRVGAKLAPGTKGIGRGRDERRRRVQGRG